MDHSDQQLPVRITGQQPRINVYDFRAVKEFERLKPELYVNAKKSKVNKHDGFAGIAIEMQEQAHAFNWLFNHPQYSIEFKQLIKDLKRAQ